MMAFRRPRNLKDYLVLAKLRPLDQDFLVPEELINVVGEDVMCVIILLSEIL